MQVLGDSLPDEITLLLHSTQLSPCTDRCMDLCSSTHCSRFGNQSKYYNNNIQMDHVKSSHFSFYSTYAIITKKKKKGRGHLLQQRHVGRCSLWEFVFFCPFLVTINDESSLFYWFRLKIAWTQWISISRTEAVHGRRIVDSLLHSTSFQSCWFCHYFWWLSATHEWLKSSGYRLSRSRWWPVMEATHHSNWISTKDRLDGPVVVQVSVPFRVVSIVPDTVLTNHLANHQTTPITSEVAMEPSKLANKYYAIYYIMILLLHNLLFPNFVGY